MEVEEWEWILVICNDITYTNRGNITDDVIVWGLQ